MRLFGKIDTRKLIAALVIIAMALVGMAGAAPEQLSTGHKDKVVIGPYTPTSMINCDPLKALKGFNEDVSLKGWGKDPNFGSSGEPYLGATAYDADGNVIDSIFAGDGLWYPSVTQLNLKNTYNDDGVMPGGVEALTAAQQAEYDANPLVWKGGPTPSYLDEDGTGIVHQIS